MHPRVFTIAFSFCVSSFSFLVAISGFLCLLAPGAEWNGNLLLEGLVVACPGTCWVVSGVTKLLVWLSFTISDRPHHSKLPGLWKSHTCHLFAPWFYRFYILMRFYFQLFFKFYSWGADKSFDTWFRSSDQQTQGLCLVVEYLPTS